jgi:Flp pilus assembly protein TadD
MLPKDTRSASHPRAASPHTTGAGDAIRLGAQGNRKDEASFLNNLASLLADQRRLQEARRNYETALEMWRERWE